MAVDNPLISQDNIVLPTLDEPFVDSNGHITKVWRDTLSNMVNQINLLKSLANATKAEVDTQHP